MFKTNKSLAIKVVSVFLNLFFLIVLVAPTVAVDLPFDANNYRFLAYNPGGREPCIKAAMEHLGIPYDLRGDVNGVMVEVTPTDLQTHDILLVGWNNQGDTTGLHADDLLTGITGRIILSGHDLDPHTAGTPYYHPAAEKLLIQFIDYVLKADGTGMITLGDCLDTFPYLPKEQWGISVQVPSLNDTHTVKTFTPEALSSGVYDDLDPCDLCYNGSYHNNFIINSDSNFVSFEIGGIYYGDVNVTVVRCPFTLTKTANSADRVKPGDQFTYTINYHNATENGTQTLTHVVLTDYLPAEVNFVSASTGYRYISAARTVQWNLGTLQPNTGGSVTVTVTVGNTRPSTGYMTNTAKITATEANEITATWRTWWYRVNNVNKNLWNDVIQTVIDNANTATGDVIKAYPGVYPENIDFDSKVLTLQSACPNDPCIVAQTIIDGNYIGGDGTVEFIANNSTLNGFTVAGTADYGVYCYGTCSPVIKNCLIRNNYVGVFCLDSAAPTITNCIVKDNSDCGIHCSNAGPAQILNNLIVKNPGYGIIIEYSHNQLIIRNNSISRNNYDGIFYDGYGGTVEPNIPNCVIWKNGDNGDGTYRNLSGTFNNVNYCCINGGYGDSSKHNIGTEPCFLDPNTDFHIKFVSPCRNTGDPNTAIASGETDIDSQNRRNGTGCIDRGADEYYGNPNLDNDSNGVVNFVDYAIFANAWCAKPGLSDWNPACDFIDNNAIDINDLAWFCQSRPPTEAEALGFGTFDEEQQPPPAVVYLSYEGSMNPDPNTEVTVYVYSDITLSNMDAIVTVTGDANITSAMNAADCNQYGWDSDWGWDPYIDEPNGIVEFGGLSWNAEAIGTVGYFKFIYNSGQVAVAITADSSVYDANSEPAVFSTDPLIFGGEYMQGSQQQMMMAADSSIAEEEADINELADWLEQLWIDDAEIRATNNQQEWQQFIDNLRSGQFQ